MNWAWLVFMMDYTFMRTLDKIMAFDYYYYIRELCYYGSIYLWELGMDGGRMLL